MRILVIFLIFFGLFGCASPQIVEQHFEQEKILHMSCAHEVKDSNTISNYVFYLNQGDTVPIKLQIKSNLIDFVENQVDLVLKKKLYFRLEIAENTSREDLEKILTITPEQMSEADPREFRDLLEKFRLFVSGNGTSWALLTDKKGVKQILGLKGGELSLGMGLNRGEGMWFLFSLKMHELENA